MARWLAVSVATWQRMQKDNVSALSAGAAFQALLTIFPTLTAVVSLYGLGADPNMVERQVTTMQGVLPPEAVKLIATWLHALVQGTTAKFGVGLVASVLLAAWSMWSAAAMLMTAINLCYGEEETRDFVSFNLRALALGAGLVLFGVAALALMAALPVTLALLPGPDAWSAVLGLVRWPMLAGIVVLALAIIYRYAPDRAEPKWQWISWGSAAATALWILGSIGFTTYVSEVGSYDKTYGSLGAVIILLLWFYLTAYVILAGAELNAELERLTRSRPVAADRPTAALTDSGTKPTTSTSQI